MAFNRAPRKLAYVPPDFYAAKRPPFLVDRHLWPPPRSAISMPPPPTLTRSQRAGLQRAAVAAAEEAAAARSRSVPIKIPKLPMNKLR